MKLEMELKPGDIVLLKLLACVLILFFMGRFLIFPGIEKHQDLVSKKDDAELTQQEMQYTIDNESTYEKMITTNQENLKNVSAGYYDLMANRQVDELVTGLVLQHDLFPVYLNIADPVPGVPAAYQSTDTDTQSTDSTDSESTSEKNEKTKESADAELNGTADSDSSDGTGESTSDTTYLQYVNTTTVTMTLQGSEERIRELLDDIATNYPGIQVRSFDMQENTYVDSNLQSVGQMNCSCVLAVYTCGELTNANTEGETTN